MINIFSLSWSFGKSGIGWKNVGQSDIKWNKTLNNNVILWLTCFILFYFGLNYFIFSCFPQIFMEDQWSVIQSSTVFVFEVLRA